MTRAEDTKGDEKQWFWMGVVLFFALFWGLGGWLVAAFKLWC